MALARHQFTVTDELGNVVPGAHIEVRREIPGQPLAALKSDRAGLVGLSNPFDADANGFAFFHVIGGAYQIRVFLGSSISPTFEAPLQRYVGIGTASESDVAAIVSGVRAQRTVTAAGDVTALPTDDIIIIKKSVGAATNVNVDWSARDRALTVVDGKGDASTNNIKIVPASGQTQYGVADYQAVIDGNGGSLTLQPLEDGSGAF